MVSNKPPAVKVAHIVSSAVVLRCECGGCLHRVLSGCKRLRVVAIGYKL
jgi:hypothetical protein